MGFSYLSQSSTLIATVRTIETAIIAFHGTTTRTRLRDVVGSEPMSSSHPAARRRLPGKRRSPTFSAIVSTTDRTSEITNHCTP